MNARGGADEPAQSVNEAKNIARMNCGAEIECIAPDGQYARVSLHGKSGSGQAGVLIMDDDSISCPLKEGDTTFIIALPRSAALDRLTLRNENAAARGTLHLAVSNYKLHAQSGDWRPVEGAVAFAHKRQFNVSLLGVEARYLRLNFHVEREGQIAALGLYGQRTLDDFAANESRLLRAGTSPHSGALADAINFNFANRYAHGRIVYISSGRMGLAPRMIDEDPLTGFNFSATDPHPTVIVELQETERINRVSAVYQAQAGKLEIFLLGELPKNGDLNGLQPVAFVADRAGEGKSAAQFEPHGARFVALRWVPEKSAEGNFEVTEIAAFGDVPLTRIAAVTNGAPDLFAENQNGLPLFENGAAGQNVGAYLTPPVIPIVSP